MTAIHAELLAGELELLRGLACGSARSRISACHAPALVRRGFAKSELGALSMTTMGHAMLAFEITRASWMGVPD